MAMIKQ